jgi:hypothetical protein
MPVDFEEYEQNMNKSCDTARFNPYPANVEKTVS